MLMQGNLLFLYDQGEMQLKHSDEIPTQCIPSDSGSSELMIFVRKCSTWTIRFELLRIGGAVNSTPYQQ